MLSFDSGVTIALDFCDAASNLGPRHIFRRFKESNYGATRSRVRREEER